MTIERSAENSFTFCFRHYNDLDGSTDLLKMASRQKGTWNSAQAAYNFGDPGRDVAEPRTRDLRVGSDADAWGRMARCGRDSGLRERHERLHEGHAGQGEEELRLLRHPIQGRVSRCGRVPGQMRILGARNPGARTASALQNRSA